MSVRYQWTDEATDTLLALWRDKTKEKRRTDFGEIAQSMNSLGFPVSRKHCCSRMKNLIYRYRKAANRARLEGKEPRHRHFKKLQDILSHPEMPVPHLDQSYLEEDELKEVKLEVQEEEEEEEEEAMVEKREKGEEEEKEESPVLTLSSARIFMSEEHQESLPDELNIGTSSSSSTEEEHTLGESLGTRTLMDGDILEFMALMQEEAEDREDARQQRLLEHETRMEERRQQWRQREIEHQERLAHMILQGVENMGQIITATQQQQQQQRPSEVNHGTSSERQITSEEQQGT